MVGEWAQHTTILSTGKGVAAHLALRQALLHRQVVIVDGVLGVREGLADGRVVKIAAERSVVSDGRVVDGIKRRILVDRDDVASSAYLGLVSGAGEVALGLVNGWPVDGVAAVAFAVIFEAGVAEAVALALRHAHLDSHVVTVRITVEAESGIWGVVREAASVNEWPERRCTGWQVDMPRLDVCEESCRRHGGSEGPKSGHAVWIIA